MAEDCPYGDREPSYCPNIYPRECYDENTRNRCCATCARHMTSTKENCEYGDKASWCSNIKSFDCYVSGETCCDKCEQLCDGPEECPCGDHLSYCIQFERRECYDSKKARDCCEHCGRLKKGPEGCEFGDRERYCSKSECSDPNRWEGCCETCADEIAAGSTPDGLTCPAEGDLVYWCSKISSRDCYYSYYQDNCCGTCKQYESAIQGCEFGDKVSWCPSYAKTEADCMRPEIADLCCASCHAINTGAGSTIERPCEDMASWCPDIFPGQCYDPNTETTCCETCKSVKKGSTDCAYGDYYTWCKPQYCNTDGEKCCVTCP
ncbi:hypothetical protein CAPTEDRAFT_216500 [Capitella teleta]|uniref:Uncharacterized protein n=1 Tax=Capitella teleta TaxID=283909 RepID=R7TKA1_CAPTE|nr:hypothetical protein CAPTEDRAFT_216500 [Capitella teleta]|eukprot:ELT91966.1 hypothetical protein CAPTEDRAFT_216500 [Capitella teleta]